MVMSQNQGSSKSVTENLDSTIAIERFSLVVEKLAIREPNPPPEAQDALERARQKEATLGGINFSYGNPMALGEHDVM